MNCTNVEVIVPRVNENAHQVFTSQITSYDITPPENIFYLEEYNTFPKFVISSNADYNTIGNKFATNL